MNQILLTGITPEDFKGMITEVLKEQIPNYLNANNQSNSDELLTLSQAAAFLKISKPTLWAYTKEGKLQKHRLGAKVYYKRSELKKAITEVLPYKHKKGV